LIRGAVVPSAVSHSARLFELRVADKLAATGSFCSVLQSVVVRHCSFAGRWKT
jgi:hypothetical protein